LKLLLNTNNLLVIILAKEPLSVEANSVTLKAQE